ncbi:alanine/glycine:cation symporter family protein [Nesterenkonia xinjiangensis]|uniref:AGCS family alanine or glycine:cation symporter n=1 Tax=Nesterenkonia xinjiangensis TaxID=225327 RepID=A0A7Z0K854_9MICC|nr:alanine/glycine:cation symporter family protein [Nesterenkonia xinjiangensis]NYJ77286.1 AGCS family alanine or glycine:cation symporter [Nesterenkonia xinjiangensis]
MDAFIEWADTVVWSPALVWLCLGAGLLFTIRAKLVQFSQIPNMIRNLVQGGSSRDGISPFQALTMSLSGRVGAGNIAGVAVAIASGGPGAVMWMWIVALLGAATSFVESTLGQIYKERDPRTGEYRGGPAFYFERVYRHTWAGVPLKIYAWIFAVVSVIALGIFLPGIQTDTMSGALTSAFPALDRWMIGVFLAIVLGIIIIGGVKRIAHFTATVVPIMAIGYIIVALIVLLANASEIPSMLRLIFDSAFGAHAVFGGILGYAVDQGVRRGIYSNEAGQGTGPHAAAATEVSHPAKQGLVQAFAVYIDTLIVCSATAFLILSTGMFQVETDDGVIDHATNLPEGAEAGAPYTQHALDTVFAGAGSIFVAIALTFFAFSTLVYYYYMAETNLTYAMRKVKSTSVQRALLAVLQVVILIVVFYGAMGAEGRAWSIGDIGVGIMAWLNIVGILLIQQPAFKALKDYRAQMKAGKDPQFDPRTLGVRNAEFWEERADAIANGTHPESGPQDSGSGGDGDQPAPVPVR